MVDAELTLGLSPGHGGVDQGTLAGAEYGIYEHNYCRAMVDDLRALITHHNLSAYPRFVIEPAILTKPDETAPPRVRGARARQRGCHAVLSVHVNALPSSSASGLHAFYAPGCTEAKRVAEAVARAAPRPLRRANLYGQHRGGRYIAGGVEPALSGLGWPRPAALLDAYAPIPTVLVELFYASNRADCVAALDPAVRLGLLCALLAGAAEAARLLAPRSCTI